MIANITTDANGVSPLQAVLGELGLDLSAVLIKEVKQLDGNPPETYDEWVRTHKNVQAGPNNPSIIMFSLHSLHQQIYDQNSSA